MREFMQRSLRHRPYSTAGLIVTLSDISAEEKNAHEDEKDCLENLPGVIEEQTETRRPWKPRLFRGIKEVAPAVDAEIELDFLPCLQDHSPKSSVVQAKNSFRQINKKI